MPLRWGVSGLCERGRRAPGWGVVSGRLGVSCRPASVVKSLHVDRVLDTRQGECGCGVRLRQLRAVCSLAAHGVVSAQLSPHRLQVLSCNRRGDAVRGRVGRGIGCG